MPIVTIRTGFVSPEGEEETLTQYICDMPGCPNAAVHLLGCIAELRALVIVCDAHTPRPQQRIKP